jgi:diamine N-acetyltransferase
MEQFVTKRLTMTLADINDLPELEDIENECEKYFSFDPKCEGNHSCSIKECLTTGDIPPGGKKENYYFYCIRQDGLLIGFLDCYLEYKQKNTAYLSSIYIKEAYRRNGIGSEIIEAIIQEFTAVHISKIRLHVSLRDATALRFWVKLGFDRIIDVQCSGNLIPGNFGGIELIRIISCAE